MTDNEIIKAKAHFEYGIKCDIFREPVLSYAETVLEAFEELNRQQAEIEALQMDKKQLESDIIIANNNYEHIKSIWENDYQKLSQVIAEWKDKYKRLVIQEEDIKAEAVREVVEELKSKSFKFMFFKSPCYELRISEVDLDNLVKERVGVDPAKVGVDYLLENGVAISKPKSMRPPADLKGKCGSCIYAKPTTWGNSKVYVECTNAEHIKIYCRRGESARKRLRTAKACKSYKERVGDG